MKHVLMIVFVFAAIALSATADIQVTYTGFNTEQQAAFEYAASLWEPILNSTVPIKINAKFQNIPGYITITIPNLIRNFTGAPMQNVWHSNSLANALSGTELNPGEADVDFIINPSSDNPWYFGLDMNCPVGSYDFVSEIHKGIAYGLGYMSSFYVQSGYGSYGMLDPSVLGLTPSFPWEPMQNQPAQYDLHVCNTQGQFLTDTGFANPSPALNAQLTGGNLRYDGTYGNTFNNDTQPVLYSGAFNLARTARLDGSTYNGTENAPGVPTGTLGPGFRYPAPIVLGILKDLGWNLDMESLMPPAANLAGTFVDGTVQLNWDEPVTPYNHSYWVERNGAEIAVVIENTYTDPYPQQGLNDYTIKVAYSMGISQYSNAVVITVANDDETMVPVKDMLLSVSPNPFSGNGQLQFKLSQSSVVNLQVFNLKGQLLGNLFTGQLTSGEHSLAWDGSIDGKKLASGLYLIRCKSGNSHATAKVVVVR